MSPKEKQKLDQVYAFMQSMKRYDTIPRDADKAIRRRIVRTLDFQELAVSAKSATSENKAVNEAGAAAYSVMDKPDGFLEIELNGTTYHVPYFL